MESRLFLQKLSSFFILPIHARVSPSVSLRLQVRAFLVSGRVHLSLCDSKDLSFLVVKAGRLFVNDSLDRATGCVHRFRSGTRVRGQAETLDRTGGVARNLRAGAGSSSLRVAGLLDLDFEGGRKQSLHTLPESIGSAAALQHLLRIDCQRTQRVLPAGPRESGGALELLPRNQDLQQEAGRRPVTSSKCVCLCPGHVSGQQCALELPCFVTDTCKHAADLRVF